MDAIEKTVERLLEWFRTEALEDRIRLYDDNDGTTLGINGPVDV